MEKLLNITIRTGLILLNLFLLACVLYGIKSYLPFQISEKYSVHQYFPFKYIYRRNVIHAPARGQILVEDFSTPRFLSRWYHLWSAVPDSVALETSEAGYRSGDCLVVVNKTAFAWALSSGASIQVAPGQVLRFSVMVHKERVDQEIGLRVDGLTQKEQLGFPKFVIQDAIVQSGAWVPFSHSFAIPEGVHYIELKIRGTGMGCLKLDNIELEAISADGQG